MSQAAPPALDVEALATLAKRFAERKMPEEASELFRLALHLDPKNMGLRLALAQAQRLQRQDIQQPSSANPADAVREELRRSAMDAAHFLGLAHLYAEKGENARAIECIEISKAKDPSQPGAYKLLGRILHRRKDFEGAAREFARALRFNPFDRETSETLGRVEYERRHFREALVASIDAFLLLNDGDTEGAERVKRRMRTLRQVLGWNGQQLVQLFHERRDELRVLFDRLEWRRELHHEEAGVAERGLMTATAAEARGGLLEVATRLRRQALLSHLSDEQVFLLSRATEREVAEKGDLLFAHGSTGADFYLLERGEITIRRPTPYGSFTLGTLGPGALFGEANFLSRFQRSADAVAAQTSEVLRVRAAELEALIQENPEFGVQLYWSFWHGLAQKLRSTNEQLRGFFAADAQTENFLRLRRATQGGGSGARVDSSDKVRLFREQGLSGKELESLATFSKERHFPPGAFVFQEGERGSEMYIVLEGRVRISKFIPGGGEEALAILDRGDFFGEMALIDGQPRSADARAHDGPATVLALDQPTVHEVLAMDPLASLGFLQLLCRLIAKRLREIDEKVIGWRILSGERSESA
jgi:CRP/FNR family transcriptional regulator, cyclic AMP receptor protein